MENHFLLILWIWDALLGVSGLGRNEYFSAAMEKLLNRATGVESLLALYSLLRDRFTMGLKQEMISILEGLASIVFSRPFDLSIFIQSPYQPLLDTGTMGH